MKFKNALTGLALCLLLVAPAMGGQPPFEANIDISGALTVCTDETLTLTADWTTNRDVTRYEWAVEQNDLPYGSLDGASSGSSTFDFMESDAGRYEVCFRIWHHTQTDRDAYQCVNVTVTECAACEWVAETAWAAGERYVEQGNWATYTPYVSASPIYLYAGQTMDAGTVYFTEVGDGYVTVTIGLNQGWRFKDVDENVKIQDYADAPSGNPSPGQFAWKYYATGSLFTTPPISANDFYGVHVDVEWEHCEE
jgi:hypothetical protein